MKKPYEDKKIETGSMSQGMKSFLVLRTLE